MAGLLHRILLVAPFVGLAAVGVVGGWTEPDPRGFGTHEQLGLGACGWREWFGGDCPTCGVTTSVSHLAHGDWAQSWSAQPVGLLLVGALVVAGFAAVRVHRRGGDLGEVVRRRGGAGFAVAFAVVMTVWAVRNL